MWLFPASLIEEREPTDLYRLPDLFQSSSMATKEKTEAAAEEAEAITPFDRACPAGLARADAKASLWLFRLGTKVPAVKAAATVFSLLGDEAVCYPAYSLGGFLLLAAASSSSSEGLRAVARRVLRLYGDFGAVCLLEQAIKALFRRRRPDWRKPATFYCIPGEKYSFASGHAMRAAYAAAVTYHPSHGLAAAYYSSAAASAGMVGHPSAAHWPFLLLGAYAAGVALARVVLGKHFLLDVAAGALVGAAAGLSPYPAVPPRGPVRVCLASCFTLEMLAIFASPRLRRSLPGWRYFSAIVVVFWLTFPFAD